MTRFANFLGLEREKLASPHAGSVKGGWFSKNKFAVHGDVQGVEGLQFTQLGTPDEDELPLQFPAWFEAGTQQHPSPQFIPQGSARCRKAVTNTGAVRGPEKISSTQLIQNLFFRNAIVIPEWKDDLGYHDKTKFPRQPVFSS